MKTLFVTAASKGIGAATARLAAANGWNVALGYFSNKDNVIRLKRELVEHKVQIETIKLDVTRDRAVAFAFDRISEVFGTLHALVNTAAVTTSRNAFLEFSISEYEKVIETNLMGTIRCCHYGAARISNRRGGLGGSIINLSSEAGRFGGDRISGYAASKGGINSLTLGLARELAADKIRVNAVSPSIIQDSVGNHPNEGLGADYKHLPMKRPGTAEEVAQAIIWLLSDAASYVSGAVIPVSGAR